jgi:23S rRNA pseudouridine1911/1915/1917 synthase
MVSGVDTADGSSARQVDIVARAEDTGKRLDKFLNERIEDLGRHQAAELCASGHVRIDGKRAKKSALVTAGATVRVELGEPEFLAAEPDLPLAVRLERPELVVVDKPAGMPSAPLKNGERGTLCGALLGRYPEMQGLGYRAREPGIVHRLDIQTSGLVLAARTREAFTLLTRALELEAIHKRYFALVLAGLPEAGEISRALAPDPSHPERVRVLEPGDLSGYARQKTTRYRVVREARGYALLEVEVGSAFRHQIRAHLASLGHPILGDAVYGGQHVPELGARHALHASQITWAGDGTLAGFTVFEPLPAELARLLGD